MAEVNPVVTEYEVELSEAEFTVLEDGGSLIVDLPERFKAFAIGATRASRTLDTDLLEGWFSPMVKRGSESTFRLDNGKEVHITMPGELPEEEEEEEEREGLGELFG